MTKRTIEAARRLNSAIAYRQTTDELELGQILITLNPYSGKRYRIGRLYGEGWLGKLCYADTIKAAVAIAERMREFD